MKASTLQSFLEECREAKTSDEIGAVVEQIEQRIATMRAARAGVEGQLQDAIVAGRDPGKIHTAIAQLDQDLMTLEAARAGFSQRREDVLTREQQEQLRELVSLHETLGEELAIAAREQAAAIEVARQACARTADIAKRHDRVATSLEAAGVQRVAKSGTIVRNSTGEVRRPDGSSEYARRMDITLADVLSMNPGQLMRARDQRRQSGRFGESYQARDHAVENLLAQAKDVERKAS